VDVDVVDEYSLPLEVVYEYSLPVDVVALELELVD
jgi:hypothetical protein